ncbi:uncharacterized protein LOC135923321 isoform X2 [Gordionus sp. m RMFG-2023]|uniref:uncharacterized protein LOC135923321 isoform X2 n=1 Tax=Gordionus sp. m RMFG-2023 TaxID=3053472 RepID=UPI0031FCD83F
MLHVKNYYKYFMIGTLFYNIVQLILGDSHANDLSYMNITMPGVAPPTNDAYFCTSEAINAERRYLVDFKVHSSMEVAHHILLYGCKVPYYLNLPYWQCGNICGDSAVKIIYAWARNASQFSYPKDVGYKIGQEVDIDYLVMQIHYLNPIIDHKDYSFITIGYSSTPPKYEAGMHLMLALKQPIPPGIEKFHVDISCLYKGPNIHPFAFRTHAHSLGRVISGYVIKHNNSQEIAMNANKVDNILNVRSGQNKEEYMTWTKIGLGSPQWPQAFYPTTHDITIKKGDILAARCTYDSRDQENYVQMGGSHSDEMCNFYMMYYGFPQSREPLIYDNAHSEHMTSNHEAASSICMDGSVARFDLCPFQTDPPELMNSFSKSGSSISMNGPHDPKDKNIPVPNILNYNASFFSDLILGDNTKPQIIPIKSKKFPLGGKIFQKDDWPNKLLYPVMNYEIRLSLKERLLLKYDIARLLHENIMLSRDSHGNPKLYRNRLHYYDNNLLIYFKLLNYYHHFVPPLPFESMHRFKVMGKRSYDSESYPDNPEPGKYVSNNSNKPKYFYYDYLDPTERPSRKSKQNDVIYRLNFLKNLQNLEGTSNLGNDRNIIRNTEFSNILLPQKDINDESHIPISERDQFLSHQEYLKLEEWPSPKLEDQIGQIGGLDIEIIPVDGTNSSFQSLIYVFHRGPNQWDINTFDFKENYLFRETGIIKSETLFTIHSKSGIIIDKWGSNMFYMPHGLTLDSQGNIWVTDVALHQVFKFSPLKKGLPSPKKLLELGIPFQPGHDATHFCKPTDIAILPNGEFFVADGYCNSRIIKFSSDGKFIIQYGQPTNLYQSIPTRDYMKVPHSLALAHIEPDKITIRSRRDTDKAYQLLFVADRENGRVICLVLSGNVEDSTNNDETNVNFKCPSLVVPTSERGRIYSLKYLPLNNSMADKYIDSGIKGLLLVLRTTFLNPFESSPLAPAVLIYPISVYNSAPGNPLVNSIVRPLSIIQLNQANSEFKLTQPHDMTAELSVDNDFLDIYIENIEGGEKKLWKYSLSLTSIPSATHIIPPIYFSTSKRPSVKKSGVPSLPPLFPPSFKQKDYNPPEPYDNEFSDVSDSLGKMYPNLYDNISPSDKNLLLKQDESGAKNLNNINGSNEDVTIVKTGDRLVQGIKRAFNFSTLLIIAILCVPITLTMVIVCVMRKQANRKSKTLNFTPFNDAGSSHPFSSSTSSRKLKVNRLYQYDEDFNNENLDFDNYYEKSSKPSGRFGGINFVSRLWGKLAPNNAYSKVPRNSYFSLDSKGGSLNSSTGFNGGHKKSSVLFKPLKNNKSGRFGSSKYYYDSEETSESDRDTLPLTTPKDFKIGKEERFDGKIENARQKRPITSTLNQIKDTEDGEDDVLDLKDYFNVTGNKGKNNRKAMIARGINRNKIDDRVLLVNDVKNGILSGNIEANEIIDEHSKLNGHHDLDEKQPLHRQPLQNLDFTFSDIGKNVSVGKVPQNFQFDNSNGTLTLPVDIDGGAESEEIEEFTLGHVASRFPKT